jgi:hypothetical protein
LWRRIDSYAVSPINNGRLGVVNAGTAWCKREPDQTQIRTQPAFTRSCRASKGKYLDGSRVSKRGFWDRKKHLATRHGSFRESALPGPIRLLDGWAARDSYAWRCSDN